MFIVDHVLIVSLILYFVLYELQETIEMHV